MPVSSRIGKTSRKGGYCTTENLLKIEEPVATGKWQEGDKITANMLQEGLGIHRAEVYLVKAAARYLHFLDDEDRVTDTLAGFARTSGDERRVILRECLQNAYPDIFHHIDLAHFTQHELKQAFIDGNYEPSARSLRPKVIALFKGLCREAGLISDEGTTPQESSEHVDAMHPVLSQETSNLDTTKSIEGDTLMVDPPHSSQMNRSVLTSDDHRAEELGEFLTRLFQLPKSPGWTEENRAWWRQAVTFNAEQILQALKGRGGMKQ